MHNLPARTLEIQTLYGMGDPIQDYDANAYAREYATQFDDLFEVIDPVRPRGEGAVQLRGGTTKENLVADSLSANAYGIYLIHYLFVIWLQYALLGISMPAFAKAATVFIAALVMSWMVSIALSHTSFGARLLHGRAAA